MKTRKWGRCANAFYLAKVTKLNYIFSLGHVSLVALFLISACLSVNLAYAGGAFSVTPVRIYMTPKERATAVTLINQGDVPVVLQADVNTWTQKADGSDELVPTEDLILSPPIIKLAPNARQVVRLVSLKPFDNSREVTYRLIVRELPEIATPTGNTIDVPIALALSLPIFITPNNAKSEISCSAKGLQDFSQVSSQKSSKQIFQIECTNTGMAYAQIREAILKSNQQNIARFSGGAYFLPGTKKILPLEPILPIPKGEGEIVVTFDDGKTQSYPVTLF